MNNIAPDTPIALLTLIVATIIALIIMRRRINFKRILAGLFLAFCVVALGILAVRSYSFSGASRSSHRSLTAPTIVHVNDDFETWQRDSAIAPGMDDVPAWVTEGASEPYPIRGTGFSLQARYPTGRTLVGYSSFNADPETARAEALASAAEQLAIVVFGDEERPTGGLTTNAALRHRLTPLEILQACKQRTEGALRDTGTLKEFTQSVQREYGKLHRVALLVDARNSTLDRYRGDVRQTLRRVIGEKKLANKDLFYTTVAALGLALVVLILYVFLNAGTKGHFAWPLRFASLGALAVLYLGMIYMKRSGW